MSVYGYPVNTTPFISEWAEQATIFTNAKSCTNWTTPTALSLMTGKRPWTHQLYNIHSFKLHKNDPESLPFILRNSGYKTMAFVSNFSASVVNLGIENGFDIAPLSSTFHNPVSLIGVGKTTGIIDKYLYSLFFNKIELYDWLLREDFILAQIIFRI